MHEDGTTTNSDDQKSNLAHLKKGSPVPIEDETKETASGAYTAAGAVDSTNTQDTEEISGGPPVDGGNAPNVVLEAEKEKQPMDDLGTRNADGVEETTDADGDIVMEDEVGDGDDDDEVKIEGSKNDGGGSVMEPEDGKGSHGVTAGVQCDTSGLLKGDDENENSSRSSNEADDAASKIGAAKGVEPLANGSAPPENGEKRTEIIRAEPAEPTKSTAKASVNGGPAVVNTAPVVPAAPPPPVMKGTLSIDLNPLRRHLIRGMWNYEHSTTFPPQRFELVRNLGPEEDTNKLPMDGEFHGSFSLAYIHTTSKGKQKERSKVISETGVKITFTKVDGENGEFKVEGTGTNQFGIFQIYGTATPCADPNDPTMNIVFRKRYEPGLVATAPPTSDIGATTSKKPDVAFDLETPASGPLPEPAQSFSTGVVSLRGNLFKEESNDLGSTEVVHRINGLWASGLDFIASDPQNVRGMCNRFEYEHKSMVPTQQFPVSGKYSGWFDLSNEDGTRTRINERDVTLKFRMNNEGYHNIDGKGSNVFGKYTITGTLTTDNTITIFRHFQARKLKKSISPQTDGPNSTAVPSAITSASASVVATSLRRPSVGPVDPKLTFDDVKIPSMDSDGGASLEPFDPIAPPLTGTYSALSRGVLRVNDDGSHSCQGKWAVTREHFTNGQTSNFTFRLEPHFAAEAAAVTVNDGSPNKFPLDSAMYKGSFQLKKQGSRYQTIVDQQIVMKFRKNKQGAFNVHGTGSNAIGEFNLLGTLVTSGKSGGQVELYRMYPPDKLAVQPVAKSTTLKPDSAVAVGGIVPPLAPVPVAAQPGGSSQQRRESSRSIKLPSRLEEDDPNAQLSRTMDKCSQILKFMREKDVELGAFFSEPVDPVALGIPTYSQVIKEPMDLRTIDRRMESGIIESPEEFSRVVRLVFENAMTFNIDPAHSVHQAGRNLLVMFNQKFRDVERMVQSIRRAHGIDVDDAGKPKDKKRKRQDELKSLKRIRLDEAQAMTAANASAVAAIAAAASATNTASVSRTEFTMLLQMIQQLQHQIVQTHTAVADLSPGDPSDHVAEAPAAAPRNAQIYVPPKVSAVALVPEKKKPVKRTNDFEETVVAPVDSAPLSLEEQELLTETINDMPQEHLGGVIQIIREAAPVSADEDEIDLEIDQLDNRTQRKLLQHIQRVRESFRDWYSLTFL